MSIYTIEKDFIDKVSAKVRLLADGKDRFRVLTPFQFDDGDQFVIVLKKMGDKWVLSDEAHTYMHLTYDIDKNLLHSGQRGKLILRALSMFDVDENNGELVLDVSNGCYGDALYDFVQALFKITDVSYLSRERVQSTFMDDFRALLHSKVAVSRMTFDWRDPVLDPEGIYSVDCRINGMSDPLFVYALSSDSKALAAALALLKFKEWGVSFRSLGILRDDNTMTRKGLTLFSNVCGTYGTYFAGIKERREEIEQYLEENTSMDVLPTQSAS